MVLFLRNHYEILGHVLELILPTDYLLSKIQIYILLSEIVLFSNISNVLCITIKIQKPNQSVDNLSSQLANDGKKLRESLEFSIQQQHSHYSELKQSNTKQNTLLEQNNKLLETQNNMTSALLMSELISK